MKSVFQYLSTKTKVGLTLSSLGIIIGVNALIGWYWSQEPAVFDVEENAKVRAAELDLRITPGFVTTSTTLALGETLLYKPGGYLSNDVTPPSIFLDNLVNWEFGVLVQLRDFTEAMREDLSRSQSQSTENKNLAKAEPKLKFDNSSWMFPPTESEYEDGLKEIEKYLVSIGRGGEKAKGRKSQGTRGQFYARADNLRNWLDHVSKRLGSISQRLSASVGQRVIESNEDIALVGEPVELQIANNSSENQTPWLEIDDNFYEARGSTWALLHLLKAIEIDFAEVLDKKAATASLQQIIRELEATQETLWSPMVLNGKGMGLLANHSLVMANYVSRANAAIIDLKNLLEQG